MSNEEILELEANIAEIKGKIAFHKKGAIHSFLISLIIIFSGVIGYNIGDSILPYILFVVGLIGLFIAYKFVYWWDFNSHVLMSIEKSDLKFFNDNPQ